MCLAPAFPRDSKNRRQAVASVGSAGIRGHRAFRARVFNRQVDEEKRIAMQISQNAGKITKKLDKPQNCAILHFSLT
jgi:hypothetical protein